MVERGPAGVPGAGGRPARMLARWPRLAALPPDVGVLALLQVSGGVALLLGARFPMSPQANVGLSIACAVIALTLAAALVAAGARTRPAALHVVLAVDTVAAGVLVAHCHTTGGAMMTAFCFQWFAVYAAFFFRRRASRAHALLIAVSLGAGLLVAGLPGTAGSWVIVSATVWTAVVAIGRLSERLRHQADTDHLTGLLNRSGLDRAATREFALAARTGNPLTLAVLDLDDFKQVNDRDGHAGGDRLLAALAAAWRMRLRPGDLLARHGGDEFVLMLPATSAAGAAPLLAHLRDAHPVRWSAGVVEWCAGESLEACIARADTHLYEVKAASAGGGAPVTMSS